MFSTSHTFVIWIKSNQETSELNHNTEQMDLMSKLFHPTDAEYIFFSESYGTFFKIDHITGHKASLNKYQETKMVSCILSHHSRIKLDINTKRNYKIYTKTQKLSDTLLNDRGS
jgi:hypothetical protein